MDFEKLAAERYSVREYATTPVEDWKIEKILEAAKLAPTAVNFQPQKLYVIKSQEAMARLVAIRPVFGAPLAIIICYDDTRSWKNSRDGGHDSGEVDAAIVTTHMMMQAWELGIGSCWVGAFAPAAVAEEFGLPAGVHPVAILPLGYPAAGCMPSEKHSSFREAEDYITVL